MTNSKQAFPQIEIQCADRVRNFCLNLGAFRALQEHFEAKTGNPEYDILEDFNWNSPKISDISVVIWAGFYTDAKKHDTEVFTVEKAEEIVDLMGMSLARQCIEESLSRMMTPEQFAKMQEEAAKAREEKAKKKALKKEQKAATVQ